MSIIWDAGTPYQLLKMKDLVGFDSCVAMCAPNSRLGTFLAIPKMIIVEQ